MSNRLRDRLAALRHTPTPIGTLLDFGIWAARNALNPRDRTFWLLVGGLAAALATAIALPTPPGFIIAGAIAAFVIGVTAAALMMTYMRSIVRGKIDEVNDAQTALNNSIVENMRFRKEVSRQLAQINKDIGELAARSQAATNAAKETVIEDVTARIDRESSALRAELDSFTQQLKSVSERATENADDLQARILDLANLFDALEHRISRMEDRVELTEAAVDAEGRNAHNRLETVRDNILRLTQRLDRNDSNEAGLIEHLEETVGELKLRLAEIERRERKAVAAKLEQSAPESSR